MNNLYISERGYDSTDFGSAYTWNKLCEEVGLAYAGRNKNNHDTFVWAGVGIVVETTVNPETGDSNSHYFAEPYKYAGFAGLIGATGDTAKVTAFNNALHTYAKCIKSESNHRDFI